MSKDAVLRYMIDNDLLDRRKYTISHHVEKSPSRIDVMSDEVVYIDKIMIENNNTRFWLEFHSATESRIAEANNYEQITRHKGHIYFSKNNVSTYKVSFVKLKLIK